MKIAVVDDSALWRKKTVNYVNRILKNDCKVEEFEIGNSFLEYSDKYDIIFMDVEMEGMDGFETTKKYKYKYPKAVVAMLTTHQEMSNRGYLVDAFRYINKENMKEEIREALVSLQNMNRNNKKIEMNIISIGKIAISENDILYIETEKRNLLVHTRTQDYVSTDSMKEVCEKLEQDGFFRCHQSYLVNLDEIDTFDDKDIFLTNNETVMLSKRQRKAFRDAFYQRTFSCANK